LTINIIKNISYFCQTLESYKLQMSYLATEKKEKIFKEYGGSEKNTGSTEGQIALFSYRINHITDHLKENKKDFSSTRSLVKLVGKRRRLLNYLAKKDLDGYREIIKRLKLRR